MTDFHFHFSERYFYLLHYNKHIYYLRSPVSREVSLTSIILFFGLHLLSMAGSWICTKREGTRVPPALKLGFLLLVSPGSPFTWPFFKCPHPSSETCMSWRLVCFRLMGLGVQEGFSFPTKNAPITI